MQELDGSDPEIQKRFRARAEFEHDIYENWPKHTNRICRICEERGTACQKGTMLNLGPFRSAIYMLLSMLGALTVLIVLGLRGLK